MSTRLIGIPNTLARDAATVFGTVMALTLLGTSAMAEPEIEPSIPSQTEPTNVAPSGAQGKNGASQEAQAINGQPQEGFSMSAALDAAASQIAGFITPVSRPVSQAPSSERSREVRCLAEAIYFEARGEPERGQLAVAEVVSNRVESRAYPNTFCGVVRQRTRNICQFSWACDNSRGAPRGLQWERANTIAERVVDGWKPNVVGNATHFHATFVSPSWSRVLPRVARIGTHVFYRSR